MVDALITRLLKVGGRAGFSARDAKSSDSLGGNFQVSDGLGQARKIVRVDL